MIFSTSIFAGGFSENWNRKNIGENWFAVPQATWAIHNSEYLWGESLNSPKWSRLVSYKKSADDYRLSFKFKFFGEQGKIYRQRAGVASSIIDSIENSAIIVWFDYSSKKVTALVRKNGKNVLWKESASQSTNFVVYNWQFLSIEKINNNVKIYLNNKKVLDFFVKINGGRVALLLEDAHADFDSLILTNLSKKSTPRALFKRCANQSPGKEGLLLPYKPDDKSRSVHVANAAFLFNTDPRDKTEKVYFYFRGTDNSKGYEQSHICLWTQPVSTFSPTDEWKTVEEGGKWNSNGVVLSPGPDKYDCSSILDTCVTKGPHGEIFIYYIGKDDHYNATLCVAKSHDGGFTFKKSKANPLMIDVGPTDIIYHNGKFYLFFADAKWDRNTLRFKDKLTIYVAVSKNPENFKKSQIFKCIAPGKKGEWDSYAVGGARVFRFAGKWWMIYQAGDSHFDFQPRMHAAFSKNLILLEKVKNDFPLFLRGEEGNWDQGAIWWGEILNWNNQLFMFYEGWGSIGFSPVRNNSYYFPGHSQIGRACCSTERFLQWGSTKD